MVEPLKREDKVSELLEFMYTINKITDDYSNDPDQMEKELNNFFYKNSDNLKELSKYFDSVEKSPIPLDIFNEFLSGGDTLNTGNLYKDEKDVKAIENNLQQLSQLKLQRIPSYKEKVYDGIEKGTLKEIIEKIKRSKIESSTSIKNRIVYKKSKKSNIDIPNLPNKLKWEEIAIRFLNGEEVQIKARDLIYQSNYELMGFRNEKNNKPDVQWDLLKLLALKSGSLDFKNIGDIATKELLKFKKRKQKLSDSLMVYFSKVEGDPFFDYRKEKSYKIRINLTPENGSNDLGLIDSDELFLEEDNFSQYESY